jgi:hypothetical protein
MVLMENSSRFIFGKQKLLLLKLKARRCGVWYKFLSRLDRVLVDLTIKVADEVRSLRLTTALSLVARKVEDALENGISQAIRKIGFPLARKLGLLAKKWGNPLAKDWMFESSFAKFLAVMHFNDSRSSFGVTS